MALSEDLIAFLALVEEDYADAVDELWQRHMTRATAKLRRTRSNFRDALRGVVRASEGFGRLPAVRELTDSAVEMAYVTGKLFILERDRLIRSTRRAPAEVTKAEKIGTKTSKSPLSKVVGNFDMSLEDTKAVKKLSGKTNMWFTDKTGAVYFDKKAIQAINDTAEKLVRDGAAASAVATSLADKAEKLYGVGTFAGKGRSYWGGIAEHAATSAGVAGQLTQLVDLGWSRYEIVNPMDQRTTPICQHLNGKTVIVSAGIAEVNAVGNASSPSEVKDVKPFASGGKIGAVNAALGSELKMGAADLSPAQSTALSNAGFATPPYHFRCRSFLDISFSAGDSIPTVGAKDVPTSALKPSKTPATSVPAPPKPKPLPSAPKPVAPAPKVVEAVAEELPPGGFPFPLDQVKVIDKQLAGANPKFVVEAPDGSQWMFKDYGKQGQPFRANVDALASRVQTAAGVETPETYVLDLPKTWKGWGRGENARETSGSIQRLFADDAIAEGSLKYKNLEDLGALGVQDAQIDHAINWVMSNGDAHYENFLLLKNGRVAGIDKAQGFKFFGKDKLAIDYVSPQPPIPASNGFAYMEAQLQRYAQGRGPNKLAEVRTASGELTDFGRRLQAIVDIPDEEYTAIIRPYLEATHEGKFGMFGRSFSGGSGEFVGKSVDDALEAILARKNALVDDIDDMYLAIARARAKVLGNPAPTRGAPAIPVEKPKASPVAYHSPTKRGLKGEIDKSELRGFYVMTGGADIEDSGMIAWRYLREGGTGSRSALYQIKGRLSKAARSRVEALAEARVAGKSGVGVADELVEAKRRVSKLGDNAVQWVKSYNSRVDPGAGHGNFGQDIGPGSSTFKRYDALVKKLDEIISGKPTTVDSIADKHLGIGTFTPTELDIEAAKHLKNQLAPYFNKTTKKLADDRWYSKGHVVDAYDSSTFKPTPKPDKPKPAENTPKERFTVTKGGENHLYVDHVGVSPDGPVLKSEWGTAAAKKNFSDINRNSRDIASAFNGSRAPVYEFKSTENAAISLRLISDKTSGIVFKGEFKVVIDKAKPTAKDFRDAWQLMRDVGIDMRDEAPTIDELKVLWARKQAKATGAGYDSKYRSWFDDIPTSIPPSQQLEELEEVFDQLAKTTGRSELKWSELTKGMKDKDYLPVFTQDSTIGGAAKPHGFPQWVRRDITEESLKDAGVFGAHSTITGITPRQLFDIMTGANNASLVATSTRAMQGIPIAGMSPVADMGTGGAQYVFTRLRAGSHSYGKLNTDKLEDAIRKGTFDAAREGVRLDPGIYYNRKSLTYTDNLFYSNDRYGEVSSADFISRNMAHTTSKTRTPAESIKAHMTTSSGNEMIARNSLGIQEHIQFVVVDSHTQRQEVIDTLKDAGIKKFGKKKVEDVIIVRGLKDF